LACTCRSYHCFKARQQTHTAERVRAATLNAVNYCRLFELYSNTAQRCTTSLW